MNASLVYYCQATGTGTGDGDGNPVPGDDIIISQATTIYPTAHPTTHTIYPTAHLITQTAHFLTWTGDGTGYGDWEWKM